MNKAHLYILLLAIAVATLFMLYIPTPPPRSGMPPKMPIQAIEKNISLDNKSVDHEN